MEEMFDLLPFQTWKMFDFTRWSTIAAVTKCRQQKNIEVF
ncbi:hypothetical protein SOVF_180600 [Spinacia oleracea]|nr:hypothetical protein SOVF_180600 [Spinacia oleracea]